MSKSRARFDSVSDGIKGPRRKKTPPEPWTWKDKLLVFGTWPAVILLMLLLYLYPSFTSRQRIEDRVEKWKGQYGLGDSQAARLLEIETEFHKTHGPFSTAPGPAAEEIKAHRDTVDALLGVEESSSH